MSPMRTITSILAISFVAGIACEHYEPPPTVTIEGLQGGLLYDSKAPLVLSFGQPIDISTLNLKVAKFDTDLEGDLGDEDDNPDTELQVILAPRPARRRQGRSHRGRPRRLDGALRRRLGAPRRAEARRARRARDHGHGRARAPQPHPHPLLLRGPLHEGHRAEKLQSGVYFVLLEVEQPLGTQIQLFGAIDVDPATGAFVAQFTNGDRNPDGTRCPTPCKDIDRCRLLPAPACVPPSLRAGTSDEYTDYVPNVEPPIGYSFPVEGCAVDDGAGSGVVTAPATMIVQSPPVTVEGLTMTAFFGPDATGQVRATGSLTADTVYLGTNKLGAGKGSMTATFIPVDKVPPGVPRPTKSASSAADAGAAASTGGTDAGR